jgi:hypothetical protein
MYFWLKGILILLIFAVGNGRASPIEHGAVPVELFVRELSESVWLVEIVIFSNDLSILELRDMRHAHDQCPEIEYEILDYSNAVAENELSPEGRIRFRPLGTGPIRITYTVSAEQDELHHSIPALTGCSAIVSTGDSVLLDGKVLFLALRPLNLNDTQYRFGSALLHFDSENHRSPFVSTGTRLNDETWRVDRVDDLLFAFLAVGDWQYTQSANNDAPTITMAQSGDVFDNPNQTISIIAQSFDALGEQWGRIGAESYTIFLTRPSLAADSFGQFTGVANPQSTALHHGTGVHERLLVIGMVHEIVHQWVPSRLGRIVEDLWIGEGLAEITAYIELVKLGYLTEDHIVSRINRAVGNLNSPDSQLQTVYDQGIVSWLIASEPSHSDLIDNRFEALFNDLRGSADQPLSSERFWVHAGLPFSDNELDDAGALLARLPCRLSVNNRVYALVEDDWPRYETGWLLSNFRAGQIVSLVAGGSAESAGLVAGDQLELIDGYGYGEIHNPLTVHFSRNGVRHAVSFLPHSTAALDRFPQYVPASAAREGSELERCDASF